MHQGKDKKQYLTHSRTRINPRGSFKTRNVPMDASCGRTERKCQWKHQLRNRAGYNVTHNLTHFFEAERNVVLLVDSPDRPFPSHQRSTLFFFYFTSLNWSKRPLKQQAESRRSSPPLLFQRLRFRVCTEKAESFRLAFLEGCCLPWRRAASAVNKDEPRSFIFRQNWLFNVPVGKCKSYLNIFSCFLLH